MDSCGVFSQSFFLYWQEQIYFRLLAAKLRKTCKRSIIYGLDCYCECIRNYRETFIERITFSFEFFLVNTIYLSLGTFHDAMDTGTTTI